jgi:hypothetical protein
MMKTAALIVVMIAAGSTFSRAQVRIEEERPAISVPLPIPEVVERLDRPVVEERRKKIETDGRGPRSGCDAKSVTKKESGETKTVTKENCGGS